MDEKLQFFPHAEGYVKQSLTRFEVPFFNYVYNYTDHLGNIRLSYTLDPQTHVLTLLEENHYYPFGLKHKNYNTTKKKFIDETELNPILIVETPNAGYQYKFNGKEWQDELGLNVTAMDFRQYDSAIGRFTSIDVLSEIFQDITPYNFVLNNPNVFSDPTGLCPDCPDPKNAKQGDVFTIENGSEYIFNNGEWERKTVEQLDEVVVSGSSSSNSGSTAGDVATEVADVVTDFIPIVGSVKDIYNGFDKGDGWQVAMGVGFLIVDVATLGSGTIVKGAVKQGIKQGTKQAAKNSVKIHKHHLIPKATFKKYMELADVMKRDVGQNLKKLPAGFHWSHKSYNKYVEKRIQEMIDNGTLNEQNIKVLQHNLSKLINQAYDNYKVTGENLNTYFKALNGN
ncbi:RHS repeat domain-containing protein [Flavobacterium sp.]|uniref:RHS repeat domain-containing protein n=1 Tax=Flavobacterium sp. TaxID=239 RepID=UPI002FD88B58